MIPFLWLGYFLRRHIHRIGWKILVILIALYALLYYGWDVSYSIYVTPFHSWEMNSTVLFAYLFRLVIGAVGSVAFIALSRLVFERKGFSWMKTTAKYGRYTLLFYTMSFVLNAILGRIMFKINYFITTPGVLDVVAIIITGMMMFVMYHCQNLMEKSKWLRVVFLGVKK